jgi:1,4-dihydroxy-6-naphthoate synthase
MFDALLHNKIDTKNYNFELNIADVENLNKLAFSNSSDISKISYNAFFHVTENYQLLNAGSALGKNCGPLIISKRKIYPDELKDCKIAIPGINTTALLLLKSFFPQATNIKEYLFSNIEEVVLSNECDAGLVIHETRFTYKEKGLKLIADLGNLWEDKFNLPIPLGGIAIKRSLPENVKTDINNILKSSIEYAFTNPNSSMNFMKQNAVELDEQIIKKHVALYVNNFSLDLGIEGKKSVEKLMEEFGKVNGNVVLDSNIFIK